MVGYIGECCHVLQSSLDGKNLEVVLLEFGVALHRVIYDHIQTYTINDIGEGQRGACTLGTCGVELGCLWAVCDALIFQAL